MSRPLSVAHVVRQFAPSIGGLEDSVLNLVRNQRNVHRVDARVVTLDRVFTKSDKVLPQHGMVGDIPVSRLPWRGSSRYPLAPSVLGAIRFADVVHVHGIDFFFDFLAATRRLHGKRLVVSTHGGFFHTEFQARLKQLWFNTITRASARSFDAVVACSENDATMFSKLGLNNLSTIENGADVAKFASVAAALPNPRRLLYFGRFAAHKRIAALFDILAVLRAEDKTWELVIAGSASDQQPAELQAAAVRANVADAVRFCIAPDDAALRHELSAATWFVCASSHEGFGIAAVEAASAGLVPVLADIPPFRRLVERLGYGLLFDPATPGATASALIKDAASLASDTPRRLQIAAAARIYDWSSASTEYVKLYDAIRTSDERTRSTVKQQ